MALKHPYIESADLLKLIRKHWWATLTENGRWALSDDQKQQLARIKAEEMELIRLAKIDKLIENA